MTRHLLFVGFGFGDDHFHRLLHDVRSVYASDGEVDPSESRLGTALVLGHDVARERLWKGSVDIVAFTDGSSSTSQGRQLEIFLDMLTAHAVESPSYFLRAEYSGMLTEPEQRLAAVLRDTVTAANHEGVRPSVREAFERLQVALGAREV